MKGDKGHTGSLASNVRRNGKMTDGKSSEQCATERKRDARQVERKTCNATKQDGAETKGREMRSERTMLADHSKNSTKQPSRNSRTNLSHILGRRSEATARQSSIIHYGAYHNNKLINGNAEVR